MYTYTVVGGPSHCYIAKIRTNKISDEPKEIKSSSSSCENYKVSSVQFWSNIDDHKDANSNKNLSSHEDKKKPVTCTIL